MPRRLPDLNRLLESFPANEWLDDAACRDRDPERFFPRQGEGTRYPVAVCNSCPVTMDCLTYAARLVADGHVMHGIWAGRNIGTMTRAQARLILSRGKDSDRRDSQGNSDSLRTVAAERGSS